MMTTNTKAAEYIRKTHIPFLNSLNVVTPSGFEEKLYEAARYFYGGGHFPSINTLNMIVEECLLWLPYIDERDFSKIVCHEVECMFKLHASALSAGMEFGNMYIGTLARLVKVPPHGFATSVTFTGEMKVWGKPSDPSYWSSKFGSSRMRAPSIFWVIKLFSNICYAFLAYSVNNFVKQIINFIICQSLFIICKS